MGNKNLELKELVNNTLSKVVWGEILFTADSIADIEQYDACNRGGDSFAYALELCLDTLINIK